jgi:hypothetical protein
MMYEERVLWCLFGSKGENVIGRWGKLHKEELKNF